VVSHPSLTSAPNFKSIFTGSWSPNEWTGWSVACVYVCPSVCGSVCALKKKMKTDWAINTKVYAHIVHDRPRHGLTLKSKGQCHRVIKFATGVGLLVDTTASVFFNLTLLFVFEFDVAEIKIEKKNLEQVAKQYDESLKDNLMIEKVRRPCFIYYKHKSSTICLSTDSLSSGPTNGLFLRVDNFAMVNGRKACDMSEVSEFCVQKHNRPTCI